MFEKSANPKGKLFLQDGDPSKNSSVDRQAMDSIGCRLFGIVYSVYLRDHQTLTP